MVYHIMTGNSGHIRVVPSKKAVGLWMFQLCCCLPGGRSYLLWFKQAESHNAINLHTPVVSIVQHWIDIVKAKPHPTARLSCIAFDSYYSSADSLNLCIRESVPFIASVKLNRHQASKLVQTGVNKPGDTNMAYNEATNELVVASFLL